MASSQQGGNNVSGKYSNVGFLLGGNNFSVGGDLTINANQALENERIEEAVAALFLTDPVDDRAKLITFKGKAVPGTCNWIDEDEKFASWRDGRDAATKLLWLSAKPGMGKTMLSIHVTETLTRSDESDSNQALLYYFCDGQDQQHNTAICVLRGLIYQCVRLKPALSKILYNEYKVQKDNMFKAQGVETLWRIFESMIKEMDVKNLYCVLDGVDECNIESLDHLLRKIVQYFGSSGPSQPLSVDYQDTSRDEQRLRRAGDRSADGKSIRMLIVSRDTPDCIPRSLGRFNHLQLTSSGESSSALKQYINSQANELSSPTSDDPLQAAELSQALESKGDGSFLWVKLASESLKRLPSQHLAKGVDNIPSGGVEGFYIQNLQQIPHTLRHLIKTMMTWVIFAVRPLSLAELETALNFSTFNPSTSKTVDRRLLMQCLYLCDSLVTVHDEKVSIRHTSVKDFFVGDATSGEGRHAASLEYGLKEQDCELELASNCVRYIEEHLPKSQRVKTSDGSELSSKEKKILEKNPLLEYAVINWTEHARQTPVGGLNFSSAFFQAKSDIRNRWWNSWWTSSKSKSAWKWTVPKTFNLMHLAAHFGILPLVVYVFEQGFGEEQMARRDGHGLRPIEYSTARSHYPVSKFLIERGNLDVKWDSVDNLAIKYGCSWTESLVHTATGTGDVETVELLLSKGVSPNGAIDMTFGSLAKGIFTLSKVAIKHLPLLMHLPKYNYEDTDNWKEASAYGADGLAQPALQIAAFCGYDQVAEALLRAGADVHAKNREGWTALIGAAWNGMSSTIRILMKYGAEHPDIHPRLGPLHAAALRSQADAIDTLLELGAPVDALVGTVEQNVTALHLATNTKSIACMESLLRGGANINTQQYEGATPLILAATFQEENAEVVRVLLKWGADRDLVDNDNASAAACARARGHETTAELIEKFVPEGSLAPEETKEQKSEQEAKVASSGSIEDPVPQVREKGHLEQDTGLSEPPTNPVQTHWIYEQGGTSMPPMPPPPYGSNPTLGSVPTPGQNPGSTYTSNPNYGSEDTAATMPAFSVQPDYNASQAPVTSNAFVLRTDSSPGPVGAPEVAHPGLNRVGSAQSERSMSSSPSRMSPVSGQSFSRHDIHGQSQNAFPPPLPPRGSFGTSQPQSPPPASASPVSGNVSPHAYRGQSPGHAGGVQAQYPPRDPSQYQLPNQNPSLSQYQPPTQSPSPPQYQPPNQNYVQSRYTPPDQNYVQSQYSPPNQSYFPQSTAPPQPYISPAHQPPPLPARKAPAYSPAPSGSVPRGQFPQNSASYNPMTYGAMPQQHLQPQTLPYGGPTGSQTFQPPPPSPKFEPPPPSPPSDSNRRSGSFLDIRIKGKRIL